MAWVQLLREAIRLPESHGDNYYYHLLMLYLPWRQETEDLLGEYNTAGSTSVP